MLSFPSLYLRANRERRKRERERAGGIRVFGVGGAGRQNGRRSEGGERKTIRPDTVWRRYGMDQNLVVMSPYWVLGIQEQAILLNYLRSIVLITSGHHYCLTTRRLCRAPTINRTWEGGDATTTSSILIYCLNWRLGDRLGEDYLLTVEPWRIWSDFLCMLPVLWF